MINETILKRSMISSVNGKIRKLLVALPYGNLGLSICGVLEELMRKMEGVEFIIIDFINELEVEENARIRERIEAAELGKDTTKRIIPVHTSYTRPGDFKTHWIRDIFLAVSKENGSTMLMYPKHAHVEKQDRPLAMGKLIADRLEEYDGVCSGLAFDGGNVLKCDSFYLIGQDSYDINADEGEIGLEVFENEFGGETTFYLKSKKCKPIDPGSKTKKTLKSYYEEGYSKRFGEDFDDNHNRNHTVYIWRGEAQPIYHLDYFVTLLGKNEKGKEVVVVGKPCPGVLQEVFERDDELFRVFGNQIEEVSNRIEEAIKSLENKDNIVIERIPLPFTYTQAENNFAWSFMSYNNCLVENYKGVKKIWMPVYGNQETLAYLKKYDDKAEKVFENLGFVVERINGDFGTLARNGGSLHCMTNEILRENL